MEENFLNLDKISALYTEFDLLEVKDILLAALENMDADCGIHRQTLSICMWEFLCKD